MAVMLVPVRSEDLVRLKVICHVSCSNFVIYAVYYCDITRSSSTLARGSPRSCLLPLHPTSCILELRSP